MNPLSDAECLTIVDQIGAELASGAIWHEDACAFMGATHHPGPDGTIVFRSFDGALYDGSSGIGLTFARLYHATQDSEYARTAMGALRHAQRVGADGQGLYDGNAGIALATHLAAPLLGTDEATALAQASLDAVLNAAPCDAGHGGTDFTSGYAGQVYALCKIDALAATDVLHEATALADKLLSHADQEACGLSWGMPGDADTTVGHLCGLAHGASGPALAFEALATATGDPSFAEHAAACRLYERSWYDPRHATWPDLRSDALTDEGPSCAHYWCQGSVGVGLERLAARDPAGQADAGAAIAGALTEAELLLTQPFESDDFSLNVSLCHGLGGMIDFLSLASPHAPELTDTARALAAFASERRQRSGFWSCGILDGGTAPGLMTGLAGAALAYLALGHHSEFGSAALPGYLDTRPDVPRA